MFACIIESLKLGLRCRMSTCMSVIKNSVQQIFIEQLEFCSNFRNKKNCFPSISIHISTDGQSKL